MKTENSKWIVHTDGGARGNPGPAAIGVVIEKEGVVIGERYKTIGNTTNNVAEYTAVIEALEMLVPLAKGGAGEGIVFKLDSLLVVQQLMGNYKIKNINLSILYQKVKSLEKELRNPVTYTYIPREQNWQADALVNKALDAV